MPKAEGMQVLSLGMSRTGTGSMKEALHILGHKRVHHAYELYTHPGQCEQWLAAWEAKVGQQKDLSSPPPSSPSAAWTRAQWDELLAGYTAVTDMPAACFAAELMAAYPEARVVLVEREEEAWLASFGSGVIDTYFDNAPVTALISLLDPQLMAPVHRLWTRLFARADGYFGCTTREGMLANALGVYRRHNRLVVEAAPPGRLLRMRLADGWGPLCEFLGEPVPDVPFPSVNEGDVVKDVVAAYVNRSLLKALRNLSVGIACFGVALFYYLRRP